MLLVRHSDGFENDFPENSFMRALFETRKLQQIYILLPVDCTTGVLLDFSGNKIQKSLLY